MQVKFQSLDGKESIKQKQKTKTAVILIIIVALLCALIALCCLFYFIPSHKYASAIEAFDNGEFESAELQFLELGKFKDSRQKAASAYQNKVYENAQNALSQGDFDTAESLFYSIKGFEDSGEMALYSKYCKAEYAYKNRDYQTAADIFNNIQNYSDARERLKASLYMLGNDAFNDGDYQAAIDYFKRIADFSDSKEHLRASYYMLGKKLLSEKWTEKAIEAFEQSEHYGDADYQILEAGKALLKARKYEKAEEVFYSLGTEESKLYYYYTRGKQAMNNGQYETAAISFSAASNTEDAAELETACRLMIAEGLWKKGYLNSAKEKYDLLPKDFTYKGISVSDRLALLEKFKSYVSMCGKWKCSKMHGSVKEVSKSYGSWKSWYNDKGDYYLTVTCTISDDGIATVKAEAQIWMYSNYSSVGEYVKSSNFPIEFEYSSNKVSYTFPYDGLYTMLHTADYSGSLTFSYNSFKVNFDKKVTNDNVYFNYIYNTYGTYDELVTVY